MEGNIEQIYKDGELVGERHVLDNRLGLAILRRLDRLPETGLSVSSRGERFQFPGAGRGPGAAQQRSPAIIPPQQSFDWELMVDALRTGDVEAVAKALALFEGDEVEEVEDPPVSLSPGDSEPPYLDLSDRCWEDTEEGWMTSFPPPAGFEGYETCPWGDPDEEYERACTPQEIAILEADVAADIAIERARQERLRDQWFAMLKAELKGDKEVLCGGPAEPLADVK